MGSSSDLTVPDNFSLRGGLGGMLQALMDPLVVLRPVRDGLGAVVDFIYVEANEPAIAYINVPYNALIGARLLDLYPSSIETGLFHLYARTIDTGEPLEVDDFVYGESGTPGSRHLDIRVVRVGEELGYTWRDTTHREQVLNEFQMLAENVSDIVFRLDPDLRIDWVSPSVEQTLGYRPDDMVGKFLHEFRHPEDFEVVRRELATQGLEIRSGIEVRVRHADGRYVWVSVSGRRMVDSSGKLLGFVGAGRNIDAEHASRRALEESESRYRLLADYTTDVVSVGTATGVLTWVSDAVRALLGWRPEELIGRLFIDIVHPEDQEAYHGLGAVLDDHHHHIYTIRLKRAEGAYRWVSISVHTVDGPGGEAARVATWRDASKQVEDRQALEHSEARYRLLAENASDVVMQTDGTGTITWISPSIEAVLGWTPEELIGTLALDLVVPEERSDLMAKRGLVIAGEQLHHLEHQFITKAGGHRWISAHLTPLRDDRGDVNGVVSGLRDASKEVEARRILAESETRYRLLAENASDLVMLVDNDLTIQWVSPSVESVLGWTPSELVGSSSLELVHEDDRRKISGAHLEPVTGVAIANEFRMMKSDGTFVWMSGRSQVTYDERGKPNGRVISQRDVVHEVAAREALAASEARYRLLAENATDIVYEINEQGIIQWISPSVQKILGRSSSELVNQPSIVLIYEADAEKCIDHRRRAFKGEPLETLEVRYVDGGGAVHWMSVSARPIQGRTGAVIAEVIGLRHIDVEMKARQALAKSEARYRLLAEHSTDIILQTDRDGVIKWISPSVVGVLGWQIAELVGTQSNELIVEEDRSQAMRWWDVASLGERIDTSELRYRDARGEAIWMAVNAQPVRDELGKVVSVIVSLRNVQSEVLSRRAVTTLSSGSRVMVRATSEIQLLNRMCQVTVDDGGYRLAWYGRRVDDDRRSVSAIAKSRDRQEYLEHLNVTWADEPRGRGPTGTAIREGESMVINDFRSEPTFVPWLQPALDNGMRSAVALPVRVDDEVDGALTVYAGELNAFDDFALSVLEDLAAELGHGLKRLRDKERLVQSLRDHQLLTSAIEQAGEAIVVSDPQSTIVYANPATARSSGYAIEELIGANPRIFQSGLQPRLFYDDMWSQLTAGESWRGVLVNRRKNGEFYEEDTTISPIQDAQGVLIAYVAVKHDLTNERRLEANLSREQGDRDAIVEVMREVRPTTSLEVTADAFCEAASRLAGIDAAALMLVGDAHELTTVAYRGPLSIDPTLGPIALPGFRQHSLGSGNAPILLSLDPDDWSSDDQFIASVIEARLCGLVAAPIRWEDQLVGVLILATKDSKVAEEIPSRFAYFEELASYAASLVGNQALVNRRRSSLRGEIRDVIDNHRFQPVFQPFVDLATGRTVGYEALTRFDDGRRPDLRFLDAHEVGLGTELEAVCVESALEAARHLDKSMYVSVNFSPDSVLDGHAKRAVAGAKQRVIIELTEHAPIDDYGAVRGALSEIVGCLVAVDDAGAGYTSLSHILELRPDFVKLDVSIVRNIDSNPARQAMAAGMCHFAEHDGTIIIAEGIETQAEADTLRDLGLTFGRKGILGQGFFFANPAALQPPR